MEKSKFPVRETVFLALGEIIVSAITVTVYLLLQKFNYTVLTGVILGSAVTVINFLILAVSVNRTVDKILAEADMDSVARQAAAEAAECEKALESNDDAEGDDTDGEEADYGTEDAAARFAAENRMKVQATVKISYVIRTLMMVAALVLAFITKQFDVLATLIPLLTFRPIITLAEMMNQKKEEKNGS